MTSDQTRGIDRTLVVVGAGPAGMYAARAAAACGRFSSIDVIEALPAPYGLVRYGVAPDHPETTRVAKVFDRAFDLGQVRFVGNVAIGRDLTHGELIRHYDAVLYATGVSAGRRLSIPGAELRGSVSAAEFVSWYSAHPEALSRPPLERVRKVVVVGGGNVALDVARLLVSPADMLGRTDMPDDVLAVLSASGVREVDVVVRKGPGDTRYSPLVLKELADLEGVSLVVDGRDVDGVGDATGLTRASQENLQTFRTWSEATDSRATRTLRFRFWTSPTRIIGEDGVEAVQAIAEPPGAAARQVLLRTDLMIHCVGFGADGSDWLPGSLEAGIMRNVEGRVQSADGGPIPRVYVAGWLKRGPNGTIATNRADAEETVARILEDLDSLPRREDWQDLVDKLTARGVAVTSWSGWREIQQDERVAGQRRGAKTAKLRDRQRMVAAAHRALV